MYKYFEKKFEFLENTLLKIITLCDCFWFIILPLHALEIIDGENNSNMFQDLKILKSNSFYSSPRMYLHNRKMN